MQKKQIILKMREHVQSRHKERFQELVNAHMQACEAKPRTRAMGSNEEVNDSQQDKQ